MLSTIKIYVDYQKNLIVRVDYLGRFRKLVIPEDASNNQFLDSEVTTFIEQALKGDPLDDVQILPD